MSNYTPHRTEMTYNGLTLVFEDDASDDDDDDDVCWAAIKFDYPCRCGADVVYFDSLRLDGLSKQRAINKYMATLEQSYPTGLAWIKMKSWLAWGVEEHHNKHRGIHHD